MKPLKAKSANLAVQGEGLRETEFSVGISEAQVIKYLTQLYSDKYRAVLSEIASNAMDEVLLALAEGREIEPYEIRLPTDDDPYLRIIDYGRGMDREFANNQLTTYGFTTKSENNVALGGKGIGLKSPLSLGPFTLETVHDGMLTVLAMMPDGGNGKPKCIETFYGPTDLPNGTAVVVPASQTERYDYERVCREFLYYMPPSVQPKVSIDVEYFWDLPGATDMRKHGIPIIYDREAQRYYGSDTELTFVVGYRPYTVRLNSLPYSVRTHHEQIVRFISKPIYIFPIGYLSISDNRETIDLDKVTVERLEKHFEATSQKLFDHFKEKLDNATELKDAREAVYVLNRATNGSKEYEWANPQGHTFKISSHTVNIEPYLVETLGESFFYTEEEVSDRYGGKKKVKKRTGGPTKKIRMVPSAARWGFTCMTQDDDASPFGFQENEYAQGSDGRIPLLYCDLDKAKNWKVRCRYFFSKEYQDTRKSDDLETWDLTTNNYYSNQLLVYFWDPTPIADAFPDSFVLVPLHELEIPSATKPKASPRTWFEGVVFNGSGYHNPFIISKVTNTEHRTSRIADLPKQLGQVYYIPVRGHGQLDLDHGPRGNSKEYSLYYFEHDLNKDINRLISKGALRKGDVICFVSKSIRNTKAWKEAEADGMVRPFLRLYKKVIEKTDLHVIETQPGVDANALWELRGNLTSLCRTLSAAGLVDVAEEVRAELTKVIDFHNTYATSQTITLLDETLFPQYLEDLGILEFKQGKIADESAAGRALYEKYSVLLNQDFLVQYYYDAELKEKPTQAKKGESL